MPLGVDKRVNVCVYMVSSDGLMEWHATPSVSVYTAPVTRIKRLLKMSSKVMIILYWKTWYNSNIAAVQMFMSHSCPVHTNTIKNDTSLVH